MLLSLLSLLPFICECDTLARISTGKVSLNKGGISIVHEFLFGNRNVGGCDGPCWLVLKRLRNMTKTSMSHQPPLSKLSSHQGFDSCEAHGRCDR